MNGKTLLNFNFKGGVGKTTLTVMETYLLGQEGKKVLLIDFDPQGNATEIMKETYKADLKPELSLYEGLLGGNLSKSIVSVTNQIDMIPTDWTLSLWIGAVEKVSRVKRNILLPQMLSKLKQNYDYIFIDVPPTINVFTNNAIMASDFISIVLQTQKQSYTSSLKTAAHLGELREQYNGSFQLVGVILYLMKPRAKVDTEISAQAKDFFGEGVFSNSIRTQERVKTFANEGIRNKDHWDKRAIQMYQMVLNEQLLRIQQLEE
ncbi:ParA family protein [Lactobacillus crispatus]|uniref:AAA family ATPase n=1 Tax=Lactobacillus crispatus TaxID=47770 RepID=A0A6A1Z5D9_9LACO|nr:ParA family protein [Lactobacillus crispatus]KAA8788051.1 AAA family ATPase [Lactobacillus crispatus]KAA8788055.1 AAA family ATPase [Lactobacillus crispatus]KAB1972933.1 AAA family ATPase [Lactobacillus crispatus]MCT3538596.1 ParA family protein [Lactobacillus crispatus]